jgi:CHAT domain-containing protein/Tfp pilus assembly protein PilF
MVINSKPNLRPVRFLLFTTLSFSILASLAIHVAAQDKIWKPGDRVEVQWQGDWYQAEVIEVRESQYKIHYVGYASSWDEWVDNSRIRAAGNNKPSTTSQPAPASSPFNEVLALLRQSYEKQAAGQTDEAISFAERALKSAEKDLGPEHGTVAMSLAALAQLYDQKKDYNRAETFYLRAIGIAEKPGSGLEPFFVATLLNGIGRVYDLQGDFQRAEPLYQRALALQEKALGPEDAQVATTLTNLGVMYLAKGDYGQAEQLLLRALAIREKATGTEEIFIIQSLKSLASLYETKGDYDKAGLLLQRVVSKLEKLLGADNPIIAPALSDFALHTKNQGDYVKAEQLYQRAIAILEKAGGPDASSLAVPLDNLGNLYQSKGDYERAEALYKRALTIKERTSRPDDPEIATTLSNLAVLYEEQRKYELAEPLLQRALAIKEKALGPMHPDVATLLSNLAVLYYDQGDYDKAEVLSQRVLTIKEKALGSEHPDVAIAVNNIAALKERRGDYKGAETLYLRALAIYEKKLGPKHPDTTSMVLNLALLSAARGEMSQAISYLTRGTDISEYNAALILATGSEEQKRRYMSTLSSETDYTISLHLLSVPNDLSAARLALTTILRRKGRALDAMTEQLASLRRRSDPQDRALLERLDAVRSQLANLVLNGPVNQSSATERQAAVAKLEAEVQRLEAAVSARSAEFRAQSQPVTIESVEEAMPLDTALIEIASYRPFNPQAKNRSERYGAARYAAYVLRREGQNAGSPRVVQPRWVDLGDAATINDDVAALRKALISPRSTNFKQVGQALYGKVMRPLLPLVGNTHRLFLSPDGDLNLIPFGALVDEQDRYLIENYSITYLTSGRDLLRLQVHTNSKQGPLVFANPSFDSGGAINNQATGIADANGKGRRSTDLRDAKFSPLPGTAGEAKALADVLSDVRVFTGPQATEAELKQVSGPKILHVATHGFFLPDIRQANAGSAGGRGVGIASPQQTPQTQTRRDENPLLRSGLALAGVNQRQSGAGEDGVLTALEATGLDLWGTKLVVLSACETGLGEIKNGEGVYGLRRALVLAGSESQVMSLWQVSDAATRDLMAAYYKRLQAGEGRTEALRQVQLMMIQSGTAEARRQEADGRRQEADGRRQEADGGRQEAGAGTTTPMTAPSAASSTVPSAAPSTAQSAASTVSPEQRGMGVERDQKTLNENRSHPFYWASFIQSGDWRSLDGSRQWAVASGQWADTTQETKIRRLGRAVYPRRCANAQPQCVSSCFLTMHGNLLLSVTNASGDKPPFLTCEFLNVDCIFGC